MNRTCPSPGPVPHRQKIALRRPDSDGAFTFDAGDGLAVCASTHKDGSLELVVNPGYLSAIELEAVIEDDEDETRTRKTTMTC